MRGLLRTRVESWKNFAIGRSDEPFARFAPETTGVVPEGGCDEDDPLSACDGRTLTFADLRLRLHPTVDVTDRVSVHATLDLYDGLLGAEAPVVGRATHDVLRVRRAWEDDAHRFTLHTGRTVGEDKPTTCSDAANG